ncbi:MAG: MarR family transcriptional regulator [Fimbriimonadaceae bacterium]|jgi:MarR family 2-MHQ and catechol resistance regulon transcriptional repressor|nr:MarR family transcriptional regulator [Fimbriimonadaceae bacterium]
MKNEDRSNARLDAFRRLLKCAEAFETVIGRSLGEYGLTTSQFNTLGVLMEHGPLSQRDIAEHLDKTGGNVTLVVDNLVKRGLVERTRDTVDRRVIYVSLTEKGRITFNKVVPIYHARVVETLKVWDEKQISGLLEMLDPLVPSDSPAPVRNGAYVAN